MPPAGSIRATTTTKTTASIVFAAAMAALAVAASGRTGNASALLLPAARRVAFSGSPVRRRVVSSSSYPSAASFDFANRRRSASAAAGSGGGDGGLRRRHRRPTNGIVDDDRDLRSFRPFRPFPPRSSFSSLLTTSRALATTTAAAAEADDASTDGGEGTKPSSTTGGKVVRFFASSSRGGGGFAAIRLDDDDGASTTKEAATGADGGATSSSSSSPGLFGAAVSVPPKATSGGDERGSTSSAGQGDDVTGRIVTFSSSGKKGIVVAHRPPVAFVLCDDDGDDEDCDLTGTDAVVSSGVATVDVSDDLGGTVVDYKGRALLPKEAGEGSAEREGDDDDDDDDAANVEAKKAVTFAPIPKVAEIDLIDEPLLTGLTAIDALAPIGKGQNTLLVDDGDGDGGENRARAAAIEAIATQIRLGKRKGDGEGGGGRRAGAKCVYGLTSPDPEVRSDVVRMLQDAGVSDDVVLVCARDAALSSSAVDDDGDAVVEAAEAVAVAAAACAVGESYAKSKRGLDAFVVVDSIDSHKVLWDATTRILADLYGIDAIAKDEAEGGASSEMRAFYSGLVQRAGRFKERLGGGSLTLALATSLGGGKRKGGEGGKDGDDEDKEEEEVVFVPEDFAEYSDKVKDRIKILTKSGVPLTAANLKKIQIPLPSGASSESEGRRAAALRHVDDLISMSDGQIWLNEDAGGSGWPPVDPTRSATRVGVGADTCSRADARALRSLAGGLRFELAQASSLEGTSDVEGAERLRRRTDAWLLAMDQGGAEEDDDGGRRRRRRGRDLSGTVVALLAASTGALDDAVGRGDVAGTEGGRDLMNRLLDRVGEVTHEALEDIDETSDLSSEVRKELEGAIESFFDL